tara:strand:- start:319 stop:456 length:138 start_codon:yes stop_codon:yes gene_type:complete
VSQSPAPKLDAGDTFPDLDLNLLDGSSLKIPTAGWAILLLYRGEW